MTITELASTIARFDLREQVEAEVRRLIAALPDGQEFRFDGSGQGWARCDAHGRGEAHLPHWTGEGYQTVRNGYVRRFCRGLPGTMPDGRELVIVVGPASHAGDAGSTSYFAGRWFLRDRPATISEGA